jgi:DNA mismatch repair protein MutL
MIEDTCDAPGSGIGFSGYTAAVSKPRIQQLSPSLVNRIAAGEVIERPAAVVKELVENALDAGATHIQIDVEEGGRELIRVTDNGGGIETDDLPLAFASHATSKLTTDDDLFRIGTMGFRGEALASIGSVSHSRILSRTPDRDEAWEILNRGGAISDPQAAAGNIGTVVEVRNLFYNTPARRKFIRGSATEYGHVSDTVLRLALPFPGVSFRLIHNNRRTLDLPAATAELRMLAGWPDDFQNHRLPVDSADAEISVHGIVGLPELARPTGKYQFLYLNGRYIRDKSVQHAVREAFRGLTEPGRYPAAVLLLEIPPGDVDVNVHPTKTEVRFRDPGRVHGLVMSAVRERLLGSDLTPHATARPMSSIPAMDPGVAAVDVREKLASFFRQPPSQMPAFPSPVVSTPAPATSFSAAPASPIEDGQPATDSGQRTTHNQQPAPPAIQLHNSYLVAQSDDGMIIIDQHALHERIMYEELLARVTRGPLESQRLLIPIVVHAGPGQVALLETIKPMLEKLGIEVGVFGPETVAIQSFPSFLEKLDPGDFVRELLERGEAELLDLHGEELLHEILDMMSCKAAVKAGDPLTPAEIEALLARRDLVDRASNCPHGRPTTLRLSLRDLDKQFKRTGF